MNLIARRFAYALIEMCDSYLLEEAISGTTLIRGNADCLDVGCNESCASELHINIEQSKGFIIAVVV